jgi:hypothetical protein
MKLALVTRARIALFAALCLTFVPPGPWLLAAVPPEVQDLSWCPGQKDCLGWLPADGATGYTLYRGQGPELSGLLGPALDSCTFGSFTSTSGAGIEDPAPGNLRWFLVTASNLDGEGTAGQASTGPRVVDSAGPCSPAGGLVLNEIDYDQPGTDFGEFVEIYNGGPEDRDLAGVVLILVNGLSSFEYARVELADAGPALPAGGYLVVGTPDVLPSLPPGTLSVALPASSNNIQNGAPDGVALFDTSATVLLDALSYEGSITAAQFDGIPGTFNLVEGNPATAADSNSTDGSLARFPDGSDTDDAATDWQFNATVSPGVSNPPNGG